MIELKIFKGKGYDCLDNNIAIVARYFNMDYEMIFMHSWGVKLLDNFSNNDIKIGKSISNGRNNRFKFLKLYHGIDTRHFVNNSISEKFKSKLEVDEYIHLSDNDLIGKIQESITNSIPISVELDPYYCSWDKGYKKYHGRHACIIVGYENETIYISDGWYMKKKEHLEKKVFLKTYYRCIFFYKSKEKYYNKISLNVINEVINRNENLNNNILKLSDVIESLNLKKEFENCDKNTYFYSTLDSRLFHIVEGRYQFAEFLKYLSKKLKINSLSYIANEFEVLAERWWRVKMKIVKSFITDNKLNLLGLKDELIYIAEYECRQIEALKKIVNSEEVGL